MAYRYERKYLVPENEYQDLVQMIRMHPAHFRVAYPPRWVNNMYFDDPCFKAVHENLEGIAKRRKFRMRWYGLEETFEPHLEIKFKQGLVGDKINAYPGLIMNQHKSLGEIVDTISKTDSRKELQFASGAYLPTLLNRYRRLYYHTPEGIRLTIDEKVAYSSCNKNAKLSEQFYHLSDMLVIEIKYTHEQSSRAAKVASYFPFRLSKNSKYVNGIDFLYNRVIN